MKKQLVDERKKLLLSVGNLLEGPMVFLGFVWLIILIAELVWGLSKPLEYISLSIWIIFIIDFLIKLVLAPAKLPFFKKNWLTAISLIIPALRVFRIFRVVRLLRGLSGIGLVRVVYNFTRHPKLIQYYFYLRYRIIPTILSPDFFGKRRNSFLQRFITHTVNPCKIFN